MQMVGEINHPEMPPTVLVDNGEIFGPIRIYKKDDLYAIISDVPIYPDIAYEFAASLAEFCKQEKISTVIVPSGVDAESTNQQESKTHGLVTDESLDKLLYDNDIPKFLAGSIVGTDAVVITVLRNMHIPLLMLYTSCHPYFPDPQASLYAVMSLARVLKLKVDTSDIQKRIDYLRIQHRSLMQETLEAMHHQEKQAQTKAPPIYR
jgi:uncharacterized protein